MELCSYCSIYFFPSKVNKVSLFMLQYQHELHVYLGFPWNIHASERNFNFLDRQSRNSSYQPIRISFTCMRRTRSRVTILRFNLLFLFASRIKFHAQTANSTGVNAIECFNRHSPSRTSHNQNDGALRNAHRRQFSATTNCGILNIYKKIRKLFSSASPVPHEFEVYLRRLSTLFIRWSIANVWATSSRNLNVNWNRK